MRLAFAANITGGMICLVPDDAEGIGARTEPYDGADPADQLHVTLAYVTEDANTLAPETTEAIHRAAAEAAASRTEPIEAEVIGYGVFGGADPPATVLFLEGDGLSALYDEIQAVLYDFGSEAFPDQHDSFVPHLTLGYGVEQAAAEQFVGETFSFSAGVTVVLGGEITDHPFGGQPEEAPAETEPTETQEARVARDPIRERLTPRATRGGQFAEATELEPGTRVSWLEEGNDVPQTGVVVEVLTPEAPAEGEEPVEGEVPAIVVVAPDSAPDERVELPAPDLTVAAEEAPEEEPAEPVEARAQVLAEGEAFAVDDDGNWEGLLIPEGVASGDGRFIEAGALTWRTFPLPLMCMFANPDGGEGHDGADLVGNIAWGERRDDGGMWGGGRLDMGSAYGVETHRLIREGLLRGVSADLDAVEIVWENELAPEAEMEDMLDFDPGLMIVTAGRIMGATVCPFPAFEEAFIQLVSAGEQPSETVPAEADVDQAEAALAASGAATSATDYHALPVRLSVFSPLVKERGALVASAASPSPYPLNPPGAWFEKPDLAPGTPVRVTVDGQVFGRVAEWSNAHIGFDGRTVPPPRSACAYAQFRKGQVLTAEGTLVATGPIVMDTVHPDLRLAASDAQAFYADTGCAVADVAVYEDRYGIVVAGAIRPTATAEQVRALRASDVSPDWRRVNGTPRECVAMLAVNNSGFKVGDALAASAGRAQYPGRFSYHVDAEGEIDALVAAGMVRKAKPNGCQLAHQLEESIEFLRNELRPIRAERAAARLAATRRVPSE